MSGFVRREGFCVFLCLFVAVTLLGLGSDSITVPWLRRCRNDSAFNDSAKNASVRGSVFSAE